MPLPITTARLELRPFTAADVEAMHAIYSDRVVMERVGSGPVRDEAATAAMVRDYIAQQDAHGFSFWAVVERATGTIIGDAGLYPLDGDGPDIEVGYTFARHAWGRGYATEAARAALDLGFDELGLEEIVAIADAANPASIRVLEKLGLHPAGDRTAYGRAHRLFRLRADDRPAPSDDGGVTLRLIRNATLTLELGGVRFLVDPMLDPAGARPAIANTPRARPNPLVELPADPVELVDQADVIVVTHLHADHVDDTAAEVIGARRPVLAQPGDAERLRARGISDVTEVADSVEHDGVHIVRTGGRHGHGAVADALGPVSGFVFRAPGAPVVYVAGDTVWCEDVAAALETHRPDVIVLNAGGARFLDSDLIVMGVDDVLRVTDAAPDAQVVAVHLEAINHCLLGRDELRAAVTGRRVAVPDDGDVLALA